METERRRIIRKVNKKYKKIFEKHNKKIKTYYGSPSLKAGDSSDLYSRSESLNLKKPLEGVTVIGLGGTGSILALFLPLYGYKDIILIDNDKVENSNRGRGLFKKKDVGKYKVDAVKNMILERRSNIKIKTVKTKFEYSDGYNFCKNRLIFDCTDTFDIMHMLSNDENLGSSYMKLGYDGLDLTLIKGEGPPIWGESQNGYRIVPSFIVPPVLVASLALMETLQPTILNDHVNINVGEIIKTFVSLRNIYLKLNINSIDQLSKIVNDLPRNKTKSKKRIRK